jgi:hypothetical protein
MLLSIVLAFLFLASMLSACDGKTSSHAGSVHVSLTIHAAQGGKLSLPGATLVIPSGALAADATVVLSDMGKAQTSPDATLQPLSDVFQVDAKGQTGKTVSFNGKATLSLQSTAFDPTTTQDVLLADHDPSEPSRTKINFSTGKSDGEGVHLASLLYPLFTSGTSVWVIRLPQASVSHTSFQRNIPATTPDDPPTVSSDFLDVPSYSQDGLGWCAPTSSTELARYYNFVPTNLDEPLDSLFGHTTALANWQTEHTVFAPSPPGAQSFFETMGIDRSHVQYNTLNSHFLESPGGTPTDFKAYVLNQIQHNYPVMVRVNNWSHVFVIVGGDSAGVDYHDSNFPAPDYAYDTFHKTWADFETAVNGGYYGNPPLMSTDIDTWVITGVSAMPDADRQGSIILKQSSITVDATAYEPARKMFWDVTAQHPYGYFFTDVGATDANAPSEAGLGSPAGHGATMHYDYSIANNTTQPLTFTTLAEVSGATYGRSILRASASVTVAPLSWSSDITGSFPLSPSDMQAIFDVKLFAVGSTTDVQDAKLVRIPLGGAPAPQVQIRAPSDGASGAAGLPFHLLSTTSQADGLPIPVHNLVWTVVDASGAPVTTLTGAEPTFSPPHPGDYVITLMATDDNGNENSVSIHVASASSVIPTTPPYFIELLPGSGSSVQVGQPEVFFATARQDNPNEFLSSDDITWSIQGEIIHQASVVRTFATPGDITVHVTATNSAGLSTSQPIVIHVLPAPAPPTGGPPPTRHPPMVTIIAPPAGHRSFSVTDISATATIVLAAQATNVDEVQWYEQWAGSSSAATLIGTGLTQSVTLGGHTEDSAQGFSTYHIFAYGMVHGTRAVTAEIDIQIVFAIV